MRPPSPLLREVGATWCCFFSQPASQPASECHVPCMYVRQRPRPKGTQQPMCVSSVQFSSLLTLSVACLGRWATRFCAIDILKCSFYQDRLGTNIGKTQKEADFLCFLTEHVCVCVCVCVCVSDLTTCGLDFATCNVAAPGASPGRSQHVQAAAPQAESAPCHAHVPHTARTRSGQVRSGQVRSGHHSVLLPQLG
jgi:hypothetical protein